MECVFKVQLQAHQVKEALSSLELHQKIDIAILGGFASDDGAEERGSLHLVFVQDFDDFALMSWMSFMFDSL